MVPRSFLTTFAACLLFSTSLAAPAPVPDANAQPAAKPEPIHAAEPKAARYAKSFIYERRQVPNHPTSTLKERDADSIEASRVEKRDFSHHGHHGYFWPHGPHPNFWPHGPRGPSSPKPSSGFSLPAIPMKERRDAPYAYFDKRDANAFAYPDHGYEDIYKIKRDGHFHHHGGLRFGGFGPAMPHPSSGFHLPQWGQQSHHAPYQFGHKHFPHKTGPKASENTDKPEIFPRAVKAPTHVQAARDEGMPRYAMGY